MGGEWILGWVQKIIEAEHTKKKEEEEEEVDGTRARL